MKKVYFALLFLFFLLTIPAFAQTNLTANGTPDPLTLDIQPQYPSPYQTITVTPSSTTFDITSAAITALVNGKAFYKGIGNTGINIQLGGPGTVTTISITAVAGGQTYAKKITLEPATVALVVEPVSSTHPFYSGGSLVAPEGPVHVVAIPDFRTSTGASIDPSTLTYNWSLGDQALDSASGIGQSVLEATAPQKYRDAALSVTVTSPDNTMVAKAETTISPVDPTTQIYRDDPLLGPLYDNALSNSYTMTGTEDTYLGVPYYFSKPPALDWTVNGTDSGTDPNITVRATGNGTGTAQIAFTANDTSSSITANSTLSVLFGKKGSLGILGL